MIRRYTVPISHLLGTLLDQGENMIINRLFLIGDCYYD